MNDRRVDADTGQRQRFKSPIIAPWCRKSPKVSEVLPLLYLHGMSSGDFAPALSGFFGSAAGLSPSATGVLGFWAALRDVWPETREQRDWVHKVANALDALPKSLQPTAKKALAEIRFVGADASTLRCSTMIGRMIGDVSATTDDRSRAERMEANKAAVVAFYDAAYNTKDYAASAAHLGPTFVQHDPLIADGHEGFEARIEWFKANHPTLRVEIKRMFADGEFVITHVHGVRQLGHPGSAIVEIFRLDEDAKIVEHWDVIQPITGDALNDNGVF